MTTTETDSEAHLRFARAVYAIEDEGIGKRPGDNAVYASLRKDAQRQEARIDPQDDNRDPGSLQKRTERFKEAVAYISDRLLYDGTLVVAHQQYGKIVLTSVRKIADHLALENPHLYISAAHVAEARRLLRQ